MQSPNRLLARITTPGLDAKAVWPACGGQKGWVLRAEVLKVMFGPNRPTRGASYLVMAMLLNGLTPSIATVTLATASGTKYFPQASIVDLGRIVMY